MAAQRIYMETELFFCSRCGGRLRNRDVQRCPHCKAHLSGEGKINAEERRRIRSAYLKRRRAEAIHFLAGFLKYSLIIVAVLAVVCLLITQVIIRFWNGLVLAAVAIVGTVLLISLIAKLIQKFWLDKDGIAFRKLARAIRRDDINKLSRMLPTEPVGAITKRDQKGNSLLHIAAQEGRERIISLLLEPDKLLPVQGIVDRSNFKSDYVLTMLNHRVDEENHSRKTAVQVAEENGFADIAALIKDQFSSYLQWREREYALLKKRAEELKEWEWIKDKKREANIWHQYSELEAQGLPRESLRACHRCDTVQVPNSAWKCQSCGAYFGPDKGTVA
jgi:ribosomal protein L37AE/L43A